MTTSTHSRHQAFLLCPEMFEDPRLASLRSSRPNRQLMFDVLTDEWTGLCERSDVTVMSNEPTSVVKPRLEHWFASAAANDVLILYYSGHGLAGADGELRLATATAGEHGSHAVSGGELAGWIAACRAREVWVIVDASPAGAPDVRTDGRVFQVIGSGDGVVADAPAGEPSAFTRRIAAWFESRPDPTLAGLFAALQRPGGIDPGAQPGGTDTADRPGGIGTGSQPGGIDPGSQRGGMDAGGQRTGTDTGGRPSDEWLAGWPTEPLVDPAPLPVIVSVTDGPALAPQVSAMPAHVSATPATGSATPPMGSATPPTEGPWPQRPLPLVRPAPRRPGRWVAGAAAVVLLVAGGAGVLTRCDGDDDETGSTVASSSVAPSSAATASTSIAPSTAPPATTVAAVETTVVAPETTEPVPVPTTTVVASAAPTTTTPPGPATIELGIPGHPLASPACTGGWIAQLASVDSTSEFAKASVTELLEAAGASYTYAPDSCSTFDRGGNWYVIYLGPFSTRDDAVAACEASGDEDCFARQLE